MWRLVRGLTNVNDGEPEGEREPESSRLNSVMSDMEACDVRPDFVCLHECNASFSMSPRHSAIASEMVWRAMDSGSMGSEAVRPMMLSPVSAADCGSQRHGSFF
jgi:hypothetical protein